FMVSFDPGYHEISLVVTDEEGRTSRWTGSFSCIKRPPVPQPHDPDDDRDGGLSITEPLILIPIILIVVLIITAAVFYVLSRRVDDLSVIEE
ncbi:MAG: hypothetical protein ACMUHB_03200, partial [Thermoplasmatota archaeon]